MAHDRRSVARCRVCYAKSRPGTSDTLPPPVLQCLYTTYFSKPDISLLAFSIVLFTGFLNLPFSGTHSTKAHSKIKPMMMAQFSWSFMGFVIFSAPWLMLKNCWPVLMLFAPSIVIDFTCRFLQVWETIPVFPLSRFTMFPRFTFCASYRFSGLVYTSLQYVRGYPPLEISVVSYVINPGLGISSAN